MRIKVHMLFREDATLDDVEYFVRHFEMYHVDPSKLQSCRILTGTILKEDFETLEAIPLIDGLMEDSPDIQFMIEYIHQIKVNGDREKMDDLLRQMNEVTSGKPS